jgi:hypothetical protein
MDMPGEKHSKTAAGKWDKEERRAVLDSLEKTQAQLKYAHTDFNRASEPELVEAAVFEINALQARYAYLLRRVRELGIVGKTALRPPA